MAPVTQEMAAWEQSFLSTLHDRISDSPWNLDVSTSSRHQYDALLVSADGPAWLLEVKQGPRLPFAAVAKLVEARELASREIGSSLQALLVVRGAMSPAAKDFAGLNGIEVLELLEDDPGEAADEAAGYIRTKAA